MSRCTDKRYEKMLHAFEMGMLDDDDYEAFRLHLLNCRHCFERVQKLQSAVDLMRYDTDIREIPGRVVDEQKEPRLRKKLWPALVPTAVVVAVIVILILKPWHFEIRPGQEAVATENRLAVMYFDNIAAPDDPRKLGDITTSLLITDLSESRYLQVVSSQRLHDILRLLGKEESKITDKEVATQVAARAGARWMLMGGILQEEPRLVFTSQVVEVSSGIVLASQRVDGEEGENVFSLVDRLTIQIKNDLPLPMAARQEADRRVADVTTHSPLAYRYYLEGMVNYHRYYNTEAAKSFRKALEIDSTFAMVYYYLSLIEDQRMIARAVEHIDRARRRDAYFIRSREAFLAGDYDRAIRELQASLKHTPDDKEAYYFLGICYAMELDFEMSIRQYKMAVGIDPLYKIVYNQMAYTYDWMGNLESSIEAINMYISLAPEEANPYDSRGDIYTRNGRLEPAIDSYLRALEMKPDFWASLYKLGKNYVLIGKFDTADSCFGTLAGCDDPVWRSDGRAALAFVPLHQGRFSDAVRILDEGIAATKAEADPGQYPLFPYLKAVAYEEMNELNLALKEYEESVRVNRLRVPNNRVYNRHFLVQLLAQTGRIDSAQAVAEGFRKNVRTERDTLRYAYAMAFIELEKDNLERAITGFEKAAQDSVIPFTPANGMLADVYLQAGRWSDALRELDKLFRLDFTDTRLYHGGWTARAHYLMGIAHEELGNNELSIEQYQIFLDLWKQADPGHKMVDDARRRLTRLMRRS